MKIAPTVSFRATFSRESLDYLNVVRQQAVDSGRLEEFRNARRTLSFNFPQGKITKELSRSNKDVFSFNPNQPVRLSFDKDNSKPAAERTCELDNFVKLADTIREISW